MKRKIIIFLGISFLIAAGFLVFGCATFMASEKEPGYRFVAAWGIKGSGPGAFNDPTGIAVTDHEVFVSDARNARIQVFDHDGNFKRQFGTREKGPGQLGRPMNLTIADSALYVADFYNQRIQRLRPDGSFVRQWGETRKIGIWAGNFNYPTDVALGRDGSVYVADGYNDRVQVFSPDGTFSHKWGGPFAMNIYGPFKGWFATVSSIKMDKAWNVFVADFYNNRIQKFSPDGTFLTAFGKEGDGPGQFEHPIAVAVTDNGNVFVADYGNNRIQKWQQKN